jgi:integrase
MKGGLRQRGQTWTCYWWTPNPSTGEWTQRSKGGFATKTLAQKHLTATLAKVQAGEWSPEHKLTVRELLKDHWLPARMSEGLRATTLAQYRDVIEQWIVPEIGGVDVRKLTPAIAQGMVDSLRAEGKKPAKGETARRGLSNRSVQLAAQVLKSATRWAVAARLIGRDPLVGYRRPRSTSPAMRAWTADEARTFLAATRNDRLGVGWALLLTRGLRRGELCGLRWTAVDFERDALRIVATRVVVDGVPTDSVPKTKAGIRSIPLDDRLAGMLRAHRAHHAQEKWSARPAYQDGGYVLADELGRPYHPDTVSEWFDQHRRRLGLPRIRLHDTRHTAASLMLASGTPVKVVADLLGHSSPTITLSIYAHVLPGMAEEAGEKLSGLVLG